MKNKPNEERISRKAAALQWTGNNTQAVMDRLAQHGMIGELFRDIYIQVYKDGSYSTTVNVGSWLVEGEDGRLRFYDDETHALMYRPIDDELERCKAFAREIIAKGSDDLSVLSAGVRYKLLVPRKCGLALDLADSLKERS